MTTTTTAVDLRGDFEGFCDLTLPDPTPEGRQEFTLLSGRIDHDAESYFGRGFCHWLAGAISSITGWDLFTVDYRTLDQPGWVPAHSGVLTPAGTVLDIFGEHTRQDVCDRYLHEGADTRPRVVASPNMPGDVITDVDHLRGDHLWWARSWFTTPQLQGMLLHFARLLLTRHGYGHHIPATAQPRSAPPVAPQPKPENPPTKGHAMSIPEEVAQLNAVAEAIPVALLQQLSETELPGEVAVAGEAMSSLGSQVQGILGNTSEASEAAASLSNAIAMLGRADETQQILKQYYSDALQSAAEAQERIRQAAQYHGRGSGA